MKQVQQFVHLVSRYMHIQRPPQQLGCGMAILLNWGGLSEKIVIGGMYVSTIPISRTYMYRFIKSRKFSGEKHSPHDVLQSSGCP